MLVAPHEPARELARDDAAEDRRHAPSVGRVGTASARLDESGAVDRGHDERVRLAAGLGTVAVGRPRPRRSRGRSGSTIATTQPPKPAPVRRAPNAPASTAEVDEQVELGRRDLEVVAQRSVAREHQLAGGRDVVARERRGERLDSRVLGHDVARDRVVGDLLDRRVAQRRDPERGPRPSRTRRAARRTRSSRAVARARCGSTSTPTVSGIGTGVIVEGAAVEEQRVAGDARRRTRAGP